MLTERQAFKLGFLASCQDSHIPITPHYLQKTAMWLDDVVNYYKTLLSDIGHIGTNAVPQGQTATPAWTGILRENKTGLTAAALAPLLTGTAAGYAAHKLTDKPIELQDIQKQEKLETLQELTQQLLVQQRK